ncbi:MAG: extracellular solute-binding protein, partial [bacterium]
MTKAKAGLTGAAALLLLALAGCGGNARPAKSVVIWWAQWDPAAGLQELGNAFEKETGIKVIVHQIPWSASQDQVFLNFGNAQTDFDVVVGDSQWIGRGATKGLYLDLTGWLPKAIDLKSVHPAAVRYLCEYPAGSKRYFAAPCETDAVGFAYRADWFEDKAEQAAFKRKYKKALRAPETWDDFKRVAEFFTRPEEHRYGCALLTGREYDSLTMGFQQVLWAYGGSWGDEKTFKVRGKLDSAAGVKALEFYKSLVAFAPKGGSNFGYG